MAMSLQKKIYLNRRLSLQNSIGNSSPSTSSPNRRRLQALNSEALHIEENNDEAERLARRDSFGSISSTRSNRRQSLIPPIAGLSRDEVNNHIVQCIKLNAEGKINEKNAFQLKIIDFLIYSLSKQDPQMSNLQLASASLNVSTKIYGIRVDKVYSELVKISTNVTKDYYETNVLENSESEERDQTSEINNRLKRKKNRSQLHILSSNESLKGSPETFDPQTLCDCQLDIQTSDKLFQTALPFHANQGIALNLYKDVILDHTKDNECHSKTFPFLCVENFTEQNICPAYSTFKFLHWSSDNEHEEFESQQHGHNQTEDCVIGFHFDLNASVQDENILENQTIMECDERFEERCYRQAQGQKSKRIVDFYEVIVNDNNPEACYEYSYIHENKNFNIDWVAPLHWKIVTNKNPSGSKIVEMCRQSVKKKKNNIELNYLDDDKKNCELKFTQVARQKKLVHITNKTWSTNKITFPRNNDYNFKNIFSFFNKSSEYVKNVVETMYLDDTEVDYNYSNDNDVTNYCTPDNDNLQENNDEEFLAQTVRAGPIQDNPFTQTQSAFINDNLVSAPSLPNNLLVSYSHQAKKINMKQIKQALWENIKSKNKFIEEENFDISQDPNNNNEIKMKNFSNLYKNLPESLSKTNKDSLSLPISFIALLNLANEKKFNIEKTPNLDELIITDVKNWKR